MQNKNDIIAKLSNGELDDDLNYIYVVADDIEKHKNRYFTLIKGFEEVFGDTDKLALFSAPGRTVIGGNHTAHQHGCVIAGSVNLDVIAAVSFNDDNVVRIKSKGYKMDTVALDDLEVMPNEYDKSISLI